MKSTQKTDFSIKIACRGHSRSHFTLTGNPINYFMSPDSYFSLSYKRSEVICPEMTKKPVFVTHCRLTPNCYATPSSIFISLIPPESRLRGLHSCRGLRNCYKVYFAERSASDIPRMTGIRNSAFLHSAEYTLPRRYYR